MVMRFLDDDYIEVSDPTEKDGGLSMNFGVTPTSHFTGDSRYTAASGLTIAQYYPLTGHILGQPSWHKLNDSTVLYWFVSSNQLCYKIIYQEM